MRNASATLYFFQLMYERHNVKFSLCNKLITNATLWNLLMMNNLEQKS